VVHAGVGHLGDLQALGQKAHAPVDLAQPLLAVQVVAVLAAVAVLGRPVHRLDHLGALFVDQVQQLAAQARVALRREVVLAPAGKGGSATSSSSSPSLSRVKALLIAA
jgi:hypothetical protein